MKSHPSIPQACLLFACAVAAFGLSIEATSCSTASSATPADDAESDSVSSSADAGPLDDSATDDSSAPRTLVRIANLSPDLGPVDFCLAPHGTTAFEGPLLGGLAETLAGGADADSAFAGLAYPQVSAYVSLAPGTYDVRVVPVGTTSCTPLTAAPALRPFGVEAGAGLDATVDGEGDANDGGPEDSGIDGGQDLPLPFVGASTLPALAQSTQATLLLVGTRSPGPGVAPLTLALVRDDGVLVGGASALRAINAMADVPLLDFGAGAGSNAVPLFVDVSFAQASRGAAPGAGDPDPDGYLPMTPAAAQEIGAGAPGGTLDIVQGTIAIDFGAVTTVIAIGEAADGGVIPQLLVCVDNDVAGGFLSDCEALTPGAAVRAEHPLP